MPCGDRFGATTSAASPPAYKRDAGALLSSRGADRLPAQRGAVERTGLLNRRLRIPFCGLRRWSRAWGRAIEDGVGCVRVLAARKELADGAEDLPLLGNALQGVHTEILELDARARD